MPKTDALVAYFRMQLEGEGPLTKSELRSKVYGDQVISVITSEQVEEILRTLESALSIEQPRGHAVKSDHRPWLRRRRDSGEIDFYYWERLKRYYLERGVLPPNVIATLDAVTDEVLDYCGDPEDEHRWERRGMVMGHVQSGKTTNYASLICKAADAGYKIVILLAGNTKALRRQTQERLEETFIGKKSLFQKAGQEQLPIVSYSAKKRFPAYGTSRDRDFSKSAAQTYGVTLAALKEPIIFVTKKNDRTLGSLRDWLREQNHGSRIWDPLLLIDDEADNASINTSNNPDKVTAINAVIRDILHLFDRSSYIGYTATPFANIFVDPDTEDEMRGHDLFPRHFIKALDPPSNYVGAKRLFSDNGDLRDRMIVSVDDFRDILPLKHKRDLPLEVLPESLYEAVRVFVLARAIRVLRGQGHRHCSMMVNVSRFNDVQEKVYGKIYEYLEQLRAAFFTNAGLGKEGLEDAVLNQCKADFKYQFSNVEFEWERIQKALVETVRTIEVRTVNMRGQALDYSAHQDYGLHVVAIGGLALSRGLTLEGLVVSYVLRNASASDTLMQMARWFGYRPDYEDLCRLYIPEESAGHYEFITEAIEELRGEVKRMDAAKQSPEDFGLRVRHSPAAIRITAPNKMRTAEKLCVAQDYSGRHVEGYALYNNAETNARNRARVGRLLADLGIYNASSCGQAYVWHRISFERVRDLLMNFEFPAEDHPDLGPIMKTRSLFKDYVSERTREECAEWDVALPLTQGRGQDTNDLIEGVNLPIRARKKGRVRGQTYFVTAKNKVAAPGDEKLGVTEEQTNRAEALRAEGVSTNSAYSSVRERPLLIIHVFFAEVAPGQQTLKLDSPVVSLSFCMPETEVQVSEHEYQVNKVYLRQIREAATEAEDEDLETDEADDV